MRLPIWQVDAFASERFRGNPAAVVVLDQWLPDEALRAIAAENNLAETAYLLRRASGAYDIRWWTPEIEVPLCGHATLASAWVIFERLDPDLAELRLASKSGELRVTRRDERFTLDFPTNPVEAVPIDVSLGRALGGAPDRGLTPVERRPAGRSTGRRADLTSAAPPPSRAPRTRGSAESGG